MAYVTQQDGKWSCSKHGEFEAGPTTIGDVVSDFGDLLQQNVPVYLNQSPFPDCPKCKAISDADLCRECEKHKATVNFSQDAMSYIHGFVERICMCCHVARVEHHFAEVQDGLKAVKEKLATEPCDPYEADPA